MLRSIAASTGSLVSLAILPLIVQNSYYLHLLIVIGIYATLLVGLDIVVGYTGEVSLGHAALFGIGCYVVGCFIFLLGGQAPWLKTWGFFGLVPLAIAVAALFGLVLALPALRVTGPYLAMVTLAFGTIIQILINEMTFLTDGPLGISIRTPDFLALFGWSDSGVGKGPQFYYVTLAFAALAVVAANRVLRSHFGRAFEALRDSPIACDCMGVSVYRYKVFAFVISAAFAGLAGALFTYSEQYISPNTYSFELTILFLLAVVLGGRKSRLGPIIGAGIIVYLPNLLSDIVLFRWLTGLIAAAAAVYAVRTVQAKEEDLTRKLVPPALAIAFFGLALGVDNVTDYRLTIFGVMILFVVYFLPDGLIGWLRTKVSAFRPKTIGIGDIVIDEHSVWQPRKFDAPSGVLLEARGVVMQFGGLRALNEVDLTVRRGAIHGLIGPNGSGKSTMMNVLSGVYQPTSGSVKLLGEEVAGHAPAEIASRGIARTFQNVQLFGEMTALENVLVGLHHSYRSPLAAVLFGTPSYHAEEGRARQRALSLLDLVGLAAFAGEQARNLAYGKQRLLEIARALALDPALLLLDEPAAGLTAPDIKELMSIINRIRDHGITVILIEHHMDVVMQLCDVVSVLDFGNKIAEGPPASIQSDPRVIEAYLGAPAETV